MIKNKIRRLRVECLNDSVGVITGISNDRL